MTTYATHDQRMRARTAAFRAKHLYPGPVGELIAQHLHAWDDFGFRFDCATLTARLVEHVLAGDGRGAA